MKKTEHPAYVIVSAEGQAEITEKKSRFIGQVFPVHTQTEAEERIAAVRKKMYDARHHCHAFALGPARETTHCSDDGEPSGTAGKPILEVLTGAGLTDTLIVVTRYFGGTLLGTGGLVRAYTQAAQAALAVTPRKRMVYGCSITADIEYAQVGSMQHYLRGQELTPTDVRYAERVQFLLNIISDDIERFEADVTELTDGRARLARGEEDYMPCDL